jgi:cytochrome c oxidase subunit 2
MLAIFVGWLILFAWALVRFRERANPKARQDGVRGAWPALAIAAVILGDVVILATEALPAWNARMSPPPADAAPLEIRITAEQYAWNIHYPGPDGVFGRTDNTLISASNPVGIDRSEGPAKDDIGLLNILTMPIDRPIVIHLTSRDVVHSFTLAQMRVKQDAVPGLVARVWFTPTLAGDWEISGSQLCGLGHYRMRGDYHVVSRDAWNQWEAEELGRLNR